MHGAQPRFWPAAPLWCEMGFISGKLPLLRTQQASYEMAHGRAYIRDAHIPPAGAVEVLTRSLEEAFLCYDDILK